MTAPRLAAFLLVGSLCSLTASATPLPASVQELEKGLTYARVPDLDRDATQLEAALSKPALILDLRDATGTPTEARMLAGRLVQMPPKPTDHRLILINSRTEASILAAVEIAEPRQLTIGPRAEGLHADIVVPTSSEEDEHAFAAFAEGTPLSQLDNSNPEKKRYDEAALAKNRAAAVAAVESDGDEDAPAAAPSPEPADKKPQNKVHDLVLERAIQLHHALVIITPQSVAP